MKNFAPSTLRLGVAAILAVWLMTPALAQQSPSEQKGVSIDWSQHHVIFSNPGTEEDAIRNGTHEKWLSIVNDPRYIIQQLKRGLPAQGPAAEDVAAIEAAARAEENTATQPSLSLSREGPGSGRKIKKDWSTPLGSGTTASQTGTFTGAPTAGQTATINTLVLTAAGSTHTGTVNDIALSSPGDTVTIGSVVYRFESTQSLCIAGTYDVCVFWGNTTTQLAQSLEAAINNNTSQCPVGVTGTWGSTCYTVHTAGDAPHPGASATQSGSIVTVTNLTYTSLTLATNDTSTFTLSGSSISQMAACSSATAGTLIIDSNSTTQQAANLAGAITACNTLFPPGIVTATSSGAVVTVTADSAGTGGNYPLAKTLNNFTWGAGALTGGTTATVQPNAYPAVYVLNPLSASCSDFAVYPTGQAGSASKANIIAYNKLYGSGTCSPAPSTYWAFNTGTGYAVTTSPIVSADGTKAAFVQSTGSSAQLVVVKWTAGGGGTLGSPAIPTTSTNITSCTAPCMTVTSLSHNDTYSSPYYSFGSDDALYVGDDSGNLEKFTGVFNGAISLPTLVSLNSVPSPIASPIYDSNSGCVFVGDTLGFLYSVSSGAGGTVCSGASFASFGHSKVLSNNTANSGIFDGPLVDPSVGSVYVFVAASGASIGNCTTGQNCVDEFAVGTITSGSMTAAPTVTEPLGTGGAGYNLYVGNFDNVYYSSAAGTGNLYAVGGTGVTSGAVLYRVSVSAGSMTGVNQAANAFTGAGLHWPSPATEFCNNGNSACVSNGTMTTSGTDYLFFSVNRGAVPGCTNAGGNGCILSYNISNPASVTQAGSGLNVTTPGTNGCWATGGFVVDNSLSVLAGASQIYFVNLNGAAAGGASGTSYASTNCTSGAGPTINATQASQASP